MIKNKILLVDDDKPLLNALSDFLMLEGFQVEALDHSLEVEGSIKAFLPDLIILDIDLGDADGRIICDELKNNPTTAHIPIILLTGLSYDEIAAIECLADGIIGKPFESSMLLFNIKNILT